MGIRLEQNSPSAQMLVSQRDSNSQDLLLGGFSTAYWKIAPQRLSSSQLPVIKKQLLSLALRANIRTSPRYCKPLQSNTSNTPCIWQFTDYPCSLHQILWGRDQ